MGAVVLILLGLSCILSAKQVYGSTCAGTKNTWMVTQGQSPCDLYQALIRLCLPTWTADVLSYGQHYASGTNLCGCNTVAASLAAACSNCQTAGTYNGPLYSWYLTSGNDATHRCASITNGSIGLEVTLPVSLKTQIPSWAWIDINSSHGYWSYRVSYLTSRDTNLTSEPPPPPPSTASVLQQTTPSTLEQANMSVLGSSISEQATLSTSEQTSSSTSEQATSSTSKQATSSTSEQITSSTSDQVTSPALGQATSTSDQATLSTSEQATSSTLGQTTSFVTYTTTATTTTTDSVTNTDTITPLPTPPPPPTQTDLSTTTSPLTFTVTETGTPIQEPPREPASQAPNSPTPTEAVIQNADSSIGSNAIWAIVGSILGAAASVATIYMCLKQ